MLIEGINIFISSSNKTIILFIFYFSSFFRVFLYFLLFYFNKPHKIGKNVNKKLANISKKSIISVHGIVLNFIYYDIKKRGFKSLFFVVSNFCFAVSLLQYIQDPFL